MAKSILWCKSHYKLEFCKEKLKEIRKDIVTTGTRYNKEFKSASLSNYITEYDSRVGANVTYAKIRLLYK